jgi:hypothetical protein
MIISSHYTVYLAFFSAKTTLPNHSPQAWMKKGNGLFNRMAEVT